MNDRAADALANALLIGIRYRTAGDVVKDLAIVDSRLGLILLSRVVFVLRPLCCFSHSFLPHLDHPSMKLRHQRPPTHRHHLSLTSKTSPLCAQPSPSRSP